MDRTAVKRRASVLVIVSLVGSVFWLATSAGAHTCVYNYAEAPRYHSGTDTILAASIMDCTSSVSNDKLTVQLWRKVTALPDVQWTPAAVDSYPAALSGDRYSAAAFRCNQQGIQDDFKNKSFFDGNHNIDASVDSGILAACNNNP